MWSLRGKCHILKSVKEHYGERSGSFHLLLLRIDGNNVLPRRIVPYTQLCETTLWGKLLSKKLPPAVPKLDVLENSPAPVRKVPYTQHSETLCGNYFSSNISFH